MSAYVPYFMYVIFIFHFFKRSKILKREKK